MFFVWQNYSEFRLQEALTGGAYRGTKDTIFQNDSKMFIMEEEDKLH